MPFEFFRATPSEARTITVEAIGLSLAVRLPPHLTGGALTVIETTNAPGLGPPLHRHRETEVFRILEGRYLFQVDDQRFSAEAGDVVSVPGEAAHAFVNVTDRPARQLVLMLPGLDAESFFEGLARVMTHGQPDRAALNAFGAPWGVEFLGPPLSPTLL